VKTDLYFAQIIDIASVVSQDKANYNDAPTEGIRRVLETVEGTEIPRGSVLQTDKIGQYKLLRI
jgi:5-oxoprolinase (ATP-hydrolysing)